MSQSSAIDDAAEHNYRLSHILRGHTQDVKAVTAAYDSLSESELILSASRDETAACWSRPLASPAADAFLQGPTYRGHRYANAVAYIQPSAALPRGQVLLGSLDSQIRCFDPLRSGKPVQVLSEHWDNISVLAVAPPPTPNDRNRAAESSPSAAAVPPCFISGSWDKSARVWSYSPPPRSDSPAEWHCVQVLRSHEQAVWGVAIVQSPSPVEPTEAASRNDVDYVQGGLYLTASADLFVRLFVGDRLHAVYAGHTDVVRSIVLLPAASQVADGTQRKTERVQEQQSDGGQQAPPTDFFPGERLFATASNDGTVRVWSLDSRRSPTSGNGGEALRKLVGHTSLVYDLAVVPSLLSPSPSPSSSSSPLSSPPANSTHLVSSGEDGTVRVWDWSTEQLTATIPQPAISVWSVAVLPTSGDIVAGLSDGTVRVYTARSHGTAGSAKAGEPGGAVSVPEQEEHDALVDGVVKQLQERTKSAEQQEFVGCAETQTQAQPPPGKELFESRWYDAVLQIDVSDDSEPLPLPINIGDDRRAVAQRFVERHDLPRSYVEEIVKFIALVLPATCQRANKLMRQERLSPPLLLQLKMR
ncbi:uncharacterized protein PFL1_05322 [Pseudozyma flocculosa PF-1]|uniref:PFU domain-containing protein n=1 Tax=Pseudozyma flocculosa PF-1 TaxID=1277687 RepID=A0A061H3H8_9BASI|nr:uncharacterized protein PFL1_05322 [Pseudozyma flocculosa PF-1]EPQ27038.1 hypothetical protein PFL1_05322 [Pseudozyma flocculosa PF-1]